MDACRGTASLRRASWNGRRPRRKRCNSPRVAPNHGRLPNRHKTFLFVKTDATDSLITTKPLRETSVRPSSHIPVSCLSLSLAPRHPPPSTSKNVVPYSTSLRTWCADSAGLRAALSWQPGLIGGAPFASRGAPNKSSFLWRVCGTPVLSLLHDLFGIFCRRVSSPIDWSGARVSNQRGSAPVFR